MNRKMKRQSTIKTNKKLESTRKNNIIMAKWWNALNSGVLDDQKSCIFCANQCRKQWLPIFCSKHYWKGVKSHYRFAICFVIIRKVENLKPLFNQVGIRIDCFAGQTNPLGGIQEVDVAVCTIEKANNMINRLIEEREMYRIGLVIVDELHMIGDTSRGYILELMLSKLIYMKLNVDLRQLQIIGYVSNDTES
ncbi:hypothetical protein DERF_002898 [Dermatophagoides farinae]|uniref:DEAD/DEAH-box helicase domain-containing protein n=1 Tax=Dermatophagoides farinae TaxID=6954 RepID=A0A922IDR7_DERFA|nr:hypothetical protein DERF_002898 [Dermatophagoides farinae]